MLLTTLFIYWSVLSIAICALLCRLIHNAKIADRALGIQRLDRQPREQNADAQGQRGDDSDRRAA